MGNVPSKAKLLKVGLKALPLNVPFTSIIGVKGIESFGSGGGFPSGVLDLLTNFFFTIIYSIVSRFQSLH